MSFFIVVGVLLVLFSGLAYVRSGRSGIAILALVAGYQLAEAWATPVARYATHAGDKLDIPVWPELPYALLVVAPAVLLLLVGKGNESRVPRLVGALAVGVLAVTLLVPEVASVISIDAGSRALYDTLTNYSSLIMAATVVIAFADLLFIRSSKSHGHDKD